MLLMRKCAGEPGHAWLIERRRCCDRAGRPACSARLAAFSQLGGCASPGRRGQALGARRCRPCCDNGMDRHDELIRLRAMRDLLETRLLVLGRAIEDQRQYGVAVADLVERTETLLVRLKLLNGRLAELRGRAPAR